MKVIIVLPAYNAEKTLKRTVEDIPPNTADEIILVDDASSDNTVKVAEDLGLTVYRQPVNRGYGANQKVCYTEALKKGADIIIMLHPDFQYDPRAIPFALGFVSMGICDIILGSRIRTRHEALRGGMPLYKYIANRFLTVVENLILGQNLGDFHSGFRVYNSRVLKGIGYLQNSDDFVFDTELLSQAVYFGFQIGDVPIPTRYFAEASSISFLRSIKYGMQTLIVMLKFILQKTKLLDFKIFVNAQLR